MNIEEEKHYIEVRLINAHRLSKLLCEESGLSHNYPDIHFSVELVKFIWIAMRKLGKTLSELEEESEAKINV